MTSPSRVVLDTNVLFPAILRDTLLRLAQAGRFEPHWSSEILDELTRNLLKHTAATQAQCEHLIQSMASAFPDAEVVDYQRHTPFLRNDLKDRHVVAAAVECDASTILTFNLKDFVKLPDSIEAVSPDDFLCAEFANDNDFVLELLSTQADQMTRPVLTVRQLVEILANTVPNFADAIRAALAYEEE